MSNILTIYDEYNNLGIKNRKVTKGVEFDLVNNFMEHKIQNFRETETNKLAVFVEPQISETYPDLVIVKYNPYNFENYNKNRLLLDNYDYKILYLLSVLGSSNCEDLVNITGDAWKHIIMSLERLIDSNLVIRKNYKWRLMSKSNIKLKNIETIEAKINKIDKVLEQAILNKKITNNSYVLSNLQENTCNKVIDKFNKTDIGLYTCNGDKYKTFRKVSSSNNSLNMYSIMINEWVGKILNS